MISPSQLAEDKALCENIAHIFTGLRYGKKSLRRVFEALPAYIDEVERLTAELSNRNRIVVPSRIHMHMESLGQPSAIECDAFMRGVAFMIQQLKELNKC